MRLLLLCLFYGLALPAQTDSLPLVSPAGISDRIFLSFEDFRKNKAVLKEEIISSENKERLGFISKVLCSDTLLVFKRGQGTDSVTSREVWGFFQNTIFYIYFRGAYWRTQNFGSICYFVVIEDEGKLAINNTIRVYPSLSPAGILGAAAVGAITTVDKVSEYLLDCRSNLIVPYSADYVADLLSSDKRLSYRFSQLSKKERRQMARSFIREFNELHPVYYYKAD